MTEETLEIDPTTTDCRGLSAKQLPIALDLLTTGKARSSKRAKLEVQTILGEFRPDWTPDASGLTTAVHVRVAQAVSDRCRQVMDLLVQAPGVDSRRWGVLAELEGAWLQFAAAVDELKSASDEGAKLNAGGLEKGVNKLGKAFPGLLKLH